MPPVFCGRHFHDKLSNWKLDEIRTHQTDASLFFPSAGRRWHDDGSLEFAGETGYYWSSSVAPGWVGKDNEGNTIGTPYANIWTMEFNYVATQAKSVINQFAHSIRCVKR